MGGVVPSAVALSVEYAPKGRRQFYNALTLTGYSVGGIVSALLAIVLLHEHGWRTLYALGALYALILPVMYFLLPESVDFLVNRGRMGEARALAARYSLDLEQILLDKDAQHVSQGTARTAGGYRLVLSRQFRTTALLLAFMTFCVQLIIYGQCVAAAVDASGRLSARLVAAVSDGDAVRGGRRHAWRRVAGRSRRHATRHVCVSRAWRLVADRAEPEARFHVADARRIRRASSIGTSSLIYGYIAAHFPTSCRGSALGAAVGRFGSILGPMIGGWIVGANLGLHWNFYAFAIPAIVAATVVPLIPKSA